MSCWVGEDVERLAVVVRAIEQHLGTEPFGPPPMTFEVFYAVDGKVHMQLHRHVVRRPGRTEQGGHPLERQLPTSCVVHQDQPVGIVRCAVRWRLVAWSVPKPQQLAIEVGESAHIGRVQNGVHQFRKRDHEQPLTS